MWVLLLLLSRDRYHVREERQRRDSVSSHYGNRALVAYESAIGGRFLFLPLLSR